MRLLKYIFVLWILGLSAALLSAQEFDHWKKNNPNNTKTINHSTWDKFLGKYLIYKSQSSINFFSYGKVSKTDKRKLSNYVKHLGKVKITDFDEKEQKAFWINLYNSLTIETVLEHYPVDTIKNIDITGIFSNGPWSKTLIKVEGKKLSLDNIEHDILRPIWKDNRIHYALNRASMGCPNLQNKAFTAKNTEQLLEKGAKVYINSPRGAYFNGKKLIVSSIYNWFQEDFGNSEKGILEHLSLYAEDSLRNKIKNRNFDLDYEYDWSLNDAR